MELEPFIILIADRDATVGVVSSMLLSSALATKLAAFDAKVRVLVDPEIITVVEEQDLPDEIQRIEEQAIGATRADIESSSLIVGFSGIDDQKLHELRERGVAGPAVNLCQFVDNLEKLTSNSSSAQIDVRDVIVSAALQFGFGGGSSTCTICEAKERENVNYWVGIADTCARFAHTVQKLQS